MVMEDIKKREYEIRLQEGYGEYQSPNRVQGLRYSYYFDGFKVYPMEKKDKWGMEIRLKRYCKEDIKEYKGKEKTIDWNKGYVKGNGIDIRYENTEKGRMEDFIVKERAKRECPLTVIFEVKCEKVRMEIEEGVISFGVDVLRYREMNITDKRGKEIKGEFKG